LVGGIVVCILVGLTPGCDGGSGDLEKPPDTTKKMDPMTDMPGFKEQQEKLKKAGKIK
jgi:hypothetical protein